MADYKDKDLYEDDELDYKEEYENDEPTPESDLQKTLKGYRIIIIALVAVLGLLTFQHFRVTSDIKEQFRIERDTLNSQISGLITEIDHINLRNDSVSNELRAHIAIERDKADSLMTRLKKERNINREKLLKIATDSLRKMSTHLVGLTDDVPIPSGVLLTPYTTWSDICDFDFILWLTEQIVMLDPMEHCIIVGDDSDWDDIDHAKCMRYVEKGLALPIGNLTSQLYSNVYMNVFDQFVKQDIKCNHYGRYVDDSTMIDPDCEWLLKQVPKVREFLDDELGLQLHMGKLHIQEIHKGVEFLGYICKTLS